MSRSIRIATRASRLALWQTERVSALVRRASPETGIEVIEVTTTGDRVRDRSLAAIGSTGVFTKELERLLLDGAADIAVHSLKDVETTLPDGLELLALPEREDPRDALLCRQPVTDGPPPLAVLPAGACVGTSSIRRRAQLAALRPDLEFIDLRGNVPTRLDKLARGEDGMQAMVLARAGLERLGFADRVTTTLDPGVLVPAVGQGALAIEARQETGWIREILRALDDAAVRAEVTAERAWLGRMHGGCQVPAGALARVDGERLRLDAVVTSLDGRQVIRDSRNGDTGDAAAIGAQLADAMLERGAAAMIAEVVAVIAAAGQPATAHGDDRDDS
jgi:hydroxymethylbilane synthase